MYPVLRTLKQRILSESCNRVSADQVPAVIEKQL
ncbi:MAG: hypothetical protein ACI8VW_001284 [bacterium]|jgi:hypothetical protein